MDKLKRQFLKLSREFKKKKLFFQRKIDRWEKKKKTFNYKQAKLLFDEAELCENEILSIFQGSDWKYNRAFLKVKITALAGLVGELEAATEITWYKFLKAVVIVLTIVFLLRNFVFGVYYVPTSSAETTLLVGDRVWGNKLTYLFNDPKVGDIVMFEDPTFKYGRDSNIQSFWRKYVGIGISWLGLKKGPQHMAKRVIAGPGDVIEGRIERGRPVVYRNGKKLHESYVNQHLLLAQKKNLGFFDRERIFLIKIPHFLRARKKMVLYSYDPKKDFEEQPFYYFDYRNVLYDRKSGRMKTYKSCVPATNKEGEVIDVFGPVILPEGKYWVMGDNRVNSVDSREWGFVDRKNISGRADFIIWSLDSEEAIWLFELIKNPFRFISLLRIGRFFKKIV